MDDRLAAAGDPRLGIGGNQPPLAEMLFEETAKLRARSAELLEVAAVIAVTDEASAAKATALAGSIRAHAVDIETARQARKAPFIADGATVDAVFGALALPLVGPEPKKQRAGAFGRVYAMVDEFRRKREAAAALQRQKLLDEAAAAQRRADELARQRRLDEAVLRMHDEADEDDRRFEIAAAEKRRDDAERIARQAERAATASGDLAAAAEASRAAEALRRLPAPPLPTPPPVAAPARPDTTEAERGARDAAAALQREAERVTAGPIDSGYGVKASRRADWKFEITDYADALKHARAVDAGAIRTAVEGVIARQIRAKIRVFPGVKIWDAGATTFR